MVMLILRYPAEPSGRGVLSFERAVVVIMGIQAEIVARSSSHTGVSPKTGWMWFQAVLYPSMVFLERPVFVAIHGPHTSARVMLALFLVI